MQKDDFQILRQQMVSDQILRRGIDNPRILEAFDAVARHLFVPASQVNSAYNDCPLPIGEGQTISQPYIVALMTDVLDVEPGMSVLEVGTGSGYQAAVLSFIGAEVKGVEKFSSLAEQAKKILDSLGCKVEIKIEDGTLGWPDHSPYDRIIVTAASPEIPSPLIDQLKIGGIIVIPLGNRFSQVLTVGRKVSQNRIDKNNICGCVFVPLIGKYGYKK